MKISKPYKYYIKRGVFLLALSTFVSFLLATTVDMTTYELGALINYLWPPFVGVMTIILFIILSFIFKRLRLVIAMIILFCLYNLYIGFALHIEKVYWPLVIF